MPPPPRPAARTFQLPAVSSGPGAPPPAGRWGHTLTAVGPRTLALYGGEPDDDAKTRGSYGDLHLYDLDSATWSRPNNGDGLARQWHTATFLPEKNLLVVFGGERVAAADGGGGGGGGGAELLNNTMVLDTDICLWYPPSIAGRAPEPRAGHTASLVGKHLVFFGGTSGRKWLSAVECMDTERWTWMEKITISGGPVPKGRTYHTATVVQDKIVFFGGSNYASVFNDLFVLDLSKGEGAWEWFHPFAVGAPPAPRTGHGAALLGDGRTVLVHGGWDPQSSGSESEVTYFKDSFLLDTELWEWSAGPAVTSGTAESDSRPQDVGQAGLDPRAGAAAREDVLRYRTGHSAVGLPRGRSGGAPGTAEQPDEEDEVVLFGGQCQNGTRLSDLRLVTLRRGGARGGAEEGAAAAGCAAPAGGGGRGRR